MESKVLTIDEELRKVELDMIASLGMLSSTNAYEPNIAILEELDDFGDWSWEYKEEYKEKLYKEMDKVRDLQNNLKTLVDYRRNKIADLYLKQCRNNNG